MVFFPELFSNGNDKFGRLAIWLITREGVVCPNLRDLFTAGGKGTIESNKVTYQNVPRIFINLIDNMDFILETIAKTSAIELSEYWSIKTTEKKKTADWIELASAQANKVPSAKHVNIRLILTEMLKRS